MHQLRDHCFQLSFPNKSFPPRAFCLDFLASSPSSLDLSRRGPSSKSASSKSQKDLLSNTSFRYNQVRVSPIAPVLPDQVYHSSTADCSFLQSALFSNHISFPSFVKPIGNTASNHALLLSNVNSVYQSSCFPLLDMLEHILTSQHAILLRFHILHIDAQSLQLR